MKKQHQRILKYKIFLAIFFNILLGCSNNQKTSNNGNEKSEYILLRGLNYSQNGNFIEAEKEFIKILKNNEYNPIVLEELAFVKLKLNEKKEALKLYEQIFEKNPKNINVIKNLAYIYLEDSNYEKSMDYLKKIPVSIEDSEVELLYREVFYKSQNWSELELLLEKKIVDKKDYDKEFENKYVESLLKQNKKDKLYFYLREKYSHNSSNESFLIFKTKILEEEYGEYKNSQRIIKRYITDHKYSDEILFSLGQNYLKVKEYDELSKMLKLISVSSIYDLRFLELQKALEAIKL
ncbi:MAG: tetratricopeptide repeat protein [Fusobacteriaceae bacterium]